MGYVGYKYGLLNELVKLAGVIVAFFVSYRTYQGMGDLVSRWTFLRVEWASALVMIFLVVLVYVLVTKGLHLLEKLVQVTFQAQLNTSGGLVVGLFRALLVTSMILVVCRQLPSPYLNASIDNRSLTGRVVSRMAPAVYDALSPLGARFLATLRAQPL